ncbi:hypothetical protein FIBSPDRAFT_848321 [Athelia psychrophila]|uniref:Uncharacterized protein n=1 Tax=Athelia psychrophila TaxID=1759441 RepID=A0A166V9U7_9AGAM|nr:hypothetical protein FIBSPDRAFT_848321 [Fibularhizoctonia sp. CBS 109695]
MSEAKDPKRSDGTTLVTALPVVVMASAAAVSRGAVEFSVGSGRWSITLASAVVEGSLTRTVSLQVCLPSASNDRDMSSPGR